MKEWRYAPQARADLDEIWTSAAQRDGIAAADQLLDKIYSAASTLVAIPNVGRYRNEFISGMSSFTIDEYIIYYRQRRGVAIARVLHRSRESGELA